MQSLPKLNIGFLERLRKIPIIVSIFVVVLASLQVVIIKLSNHQEASAFSVSSIVPSSGPISGGTDVTLTGDFPDSPNIVKIVSGYYSSLAIDDKGNLYSWGYDLYGQIGDGELTHNHSTEPGYERTVIAPIRLTGLDTGTTFPNDLKDSKIIDIAALGWAFYAVDDQGNLYSWGNDYYGQLGDGELTLGHKTDVSTGDNILAPRKLTGLDTGTTYTNALKDVKVKAVFGGSHGTVFAIDYDYNLYGWGNDVRGMLGDGNLTANHSVVDDGADVVLAPIKLSGLDTGTTFINYLKDAEITDVYAGNTHTLAVDRQGNLYAWGWDGRGQVGDGSVVQNHTTSPIDGTNIVIAPVKLTGLNTGSTYTNALKDAVIVAVGGGSVHSVAIDNHGNLYAWGDDTYGEVGDGELTQNHNTSPTVADRVLAPIKLSGLDTGTTYTNALKDAKIIDVSSSTAGTSTFAVDDQGNLYAFGADDFYQIGDGEEVLNHKILTYQGADTDSVIAPVSITGLDTGTTYTNALKDAKALRISASRYNTNIIDIQGDVYSWGIAAYGQIGDGDLGTNRPSVNPYFAGAAVKISGLNTGNTYKNALNIDYTVTVGGKPCVNTVYVSQTTITCTTSAHSKGITDVMVGNGLTNSVLSGGYIYEPQFIPDVPNTGKL